MRSFVIALIFLCSPTLALAQGDKKPPEIKKVQVGFQIFQNEEQSAYKVGLWTPVNVELFGGSDGIDIRGGEIPYLDIEAVDSEDVGTRIRVPVNVNPLQTQTVIGYVKSGRKGGANEIRVNLRAGGRDHTPLVNEQSWPLDIDAHLYLTLGAKLVDVQRAACGLDRKADDKDNDDLRFDPNGFRQVVYQNRIDRLPESWFGYNGVDLIILATSNDKFLSGLGKSPKRLSALAQWVRRGGRLVVPIMHENQPLVAALLKAPAAWDPPIPVVPPANGQGVPLKSVNVAQWGAVQDHPFERDDPRTQKVTVALLDPGKVAPGDWTVLAESSPETGSRPLIAQVRYGLGQITYMAFSFEDPHFVAWAGKDRFLQTALNKLAPRSAGNLRDVERFGGRQNDPNDLSTELLGMLDNFDVKVIPFGYVALFIVLYILVVGPLDFILLKYVLKRLEWTWITFPAVVLAVSVIAYFAAFALKGRDLKINKVDIVDFDLRTTADAKNVHAYGHSFFTILSPRIQNYTIGLEPNPAFWGDAARKVKHNGAEMDEVLSVDLLSWMGRPSGGPHDMGRSGSAGFFKKPYAFRADAAAVEGVPIPVWTTKAFSASWEQTLTAPPFVADLVYHTREVQGKDLRLAGKLENHLAVDLVDAALIYDDHVYPVPGGLKSVKNGARPQPLALTRPEAKDMHNWVNPGAADDAAPETRAWSSDPMPLVKRILFHEKIDTQNVMRNHLLRPLDIGWRIQEESRDKQKERRTREAILFARVRHVTGSAETVTRDAERPVPTKLWLYDTPATGKSRPDLVGQLNQDTYIRVILPVRPGDE